ncbi:MAG TPA: UbiA family prenyltransferase [Gaiellaceae bacterium]|nr:UbiA family prenyltransferase [Gaiellaceae bacterium]
METVADDLVSMRPRAASARSLARGLRVRQWPKNLLLFAGLLFAAKLGDASRWGEAWLAFAAYCAGSSAAYLVNDVRDAERDRLHPTKRHRPVASGRLSPRTALGIAAALAVAGSAAAAGLGIESLGFFACFLALQLAYTFRLKKVVGLDVLTIAALFTIRAAAGAEAVHVRVSPWLLACTALLALFLGLAKRRGELGLGGSDGSLRRPVLAHYSVAVLDRLLVGVAAAAVGAYTAYTLSARSSLEMVVTVPFVVIAIGRYLLLVHRHGAGEEPEEVLLGDAPILVVLVAWAVTAALVLTLS